jgi:hypothetical protein
VRPTGLTRIRTVIEVLLCCVLLSMSTGCSEEEYCEDPVVLYYETEPSLFDDTTTYTYPVLGCEGN